MGAFWRGWRVVALDGTQFTLINTPQIVDTLPKARTRRGRAAFAKITTGVLLELGLHNPLAAAIGWHGESEWALAQRLLAQLPKRAVLLGDRLYGVVAFARAAQLACRQSVPAPRLPDGQAAGGQTAERRHAARRPPRPRSACSQPGHRVARGARDSRARRTTRHRSHDLRLWTSLLDPRPAPALELAQLYAQRLEHELYFRELKR